MEYRGKAKGNKKSEIVRYIFENHNASKTEMTNALKLSMPTILQNTNELIEQGFLIESGEYESTGGRRAKSLAINGKMAYSVGLDITTEHITFVLLNFAGDPVKHIRKKKEFSNTLTYYKELADDLDEFLQSAGIFREMILGVGIALPGIINDEEKTMIKSHSLKMTGTSLKVVEQVIPYPIHFENDANAAMIAERENVNADAIYLFLSDTVGGAIKIGGHLFRGSNRKAGEIGHTLLIPNGKECYCGKKGCVDAYCSLHALEQASGLSLDEFMKKVSAHDTKMMKIWEDFIDKLAMVISNLRMIHDTEIIIGGDICEYLESHMLEIGERVKLYNNFDNDISYLKNSKYKKGSAASGAALHFIFQYMQNIY